MLRDIRELLAERGPTELRDLAIHFEADPSAIAGMLEFLESRNQVKRIVVSCGTGGCSGCSGCGSKQSERTAEPNDEGVTFWAIEKQRL
jgi:hypothetical protein